MVRFCEHHRDCAECASESHDAVDEQFRVLAWFDGVRDQGQRHQFLWHLVKDSTYADKLYLRNLLDRELPEETDPLRSLPRTVCAKIFGHLDPRSLSRCARVCHAWYDFSVLDGHWKQKCVRRGWFLPYVPTPFEQGAWKVFYVGQVLALRSNSTVLHPLDRNVTLLRNLLHETQTPEAKEDDRFIEDGTPMDPDSFDFADSLLRTKALGARPLPVPSKVCRACGRGVAWRGVACSQSGRQQGAPRVRCLACSAPGTLSPRPVACRRTVRLFARALRRPCPGSRQT